MQCRSALPLRQLHLYAASRREAMSLNSTLQINRTMRKALTHRSSRIAITIAAVCLFAAPVSAGPIKFSITGAVTNDLFGVFGNATFTGLYTFDSNATQVLTLPTAVDMRDRAGTFR
jgi:hypothetical protein